MRDNKKLLKVGAIFIMVAVFVEIFGFNYETFFSAFDKSESVSFTASEGFNSKDGKTYYCPELAENESENPPYFEIKDINKEVKYLYLDIVPEFQGDVNEACFDVYLLDEGNSEYYSCTTVKMHPLYKKTEYIRLHSYGKIKAVKLVFNSDNYKGLNTSVTVNKFVINARVPMFFSVIRVLLIAIFLAVLYMFRPSSELYYKDAFSPSKKLRYLRFAFMLANLGLVAFLIVNNLTFANPMNDTYRQYNLLAEAICNGRVNIDVTHGELMKQVVHPYDMYEREAVLVQNGIIGDRQPWWDIAFFDGKFYVYFGVVPALLFFVPVYAIAKTHMIMSAAVFIVCCMIVLGAYSLTESIVKLYFPKASFGAALFASVMLANCTGLLIYGMTPTIYYMVILISIMFVYFGLSFWLKARLNIDDGGGNKKSCAYICAGSLCMALVAGCRPQFLLASFLIIPIFKSVIYKDYRVEIKGNISKYLCVIIPYAVVAAGLMYYNYIRFNSPFDFGANYNLTTNYMPLRGFNLARLVDGTLMYFLQPPDISFRFPFIHGTKFHTDYVGLTVIEPMYGGVLFICPFTLLLFMLPKLKISLKSKKLYLFVIMLVAMTVLVAFADTEMSALLLRYFGDFLYMLILGAVIIMFTLLERYGNKRGIISAAVALGMITVMLSFFLGVNETTFSPGVTEGLFRIYSMFI